MVYAVFVNGIANFGLTLGYERNFFEYTSEKDRGGLLFGIVLFVLTCFGVFGSLTYLFRTQLSEWIIGSKDHGMVLFWSYCGASMMTLKLYFLTYLKNSENAKSFVKFSIVESVGLVSFSLFLIAFLKVGVIGLPLGQFLASGVVFMALTIRFISHVPFSVNLQGLKSSLKLSLPLTPRIFFGVIGNHFDKYMIGLLNTVGGVGIYNLGQKVANILFTFMTALQNVFSPQVYQRMFNMEPNEGAKSIGKYLTPFLYFSIAGGFLLALFSEELIMLLTPAEYHGAIDVVGVLALLYGTYFFGKQPQLVYAKKTGLISILTLVGIALNVIFNVPFIYLWGVMGAAWGTLLAGLISGTISFVYSQRHYYIQWEYKNLVAIFLIFSIGTLTSMYLRNLELTYLLRLSHKLIFFGVFLLLGNKIGIINRQGFRLVKGLIAPTASKAS